MAGTSLDGIIDVALIETDGQNHVTPLDFFAYKVPDYNRALIAEAFGKRKPDTQTKAAETYITQTHIDAVRASGFTAELIGFHGQTITHDPAANFTWQLGDGAAMAAALQTQTINDFRTADVAAGGQGAPLAPLYHAAIFAEHKKPLAILNLGGVGNITYLGQDQILAFDTGPANALLDDYTAKYFGKPFDENGAIAKAGIADQAVIESFLAHEYFAAKPPKSLDRNDFESILSRLPQNPKDAMATLTMLSAASIIAALKHLPKPPATWYICGGGRNNAHMMDLLAQALAPATILPIEATFHNGDATEAQAFAYLAVRSKLELPLSLPTTTGIKSAMTGGVAHKA